MSAKLTSVFPLRYTDGEVVTATPESQQILDMLRVYFRRAEPDLQGPITVEDSVRMQLETIDKLDEKLSGSFVSHHGNKNWF